MAWIVRLVKINAESKKLIRDVMEITRPDDLGDIADLGLRFDETKRLLAGLRQEVISARVSDHAAQRPSFSRRGAGRRVKDHQNYVMSKLFSRVTASLPRFRCSGCGRNASGIALALAYRSTPELDQLQARLAHLIHETGSPSFHYV